MSHPADIEADRIRRRDLSFDQQETRRMARDGFLASPLRATAYGWYNPDGRPLSADWKIKGLPAPVQVQAP